MPLVSRLKRFFKGRLCKDDLFAPKVDLNAWLGRPDFLSGSTYAVYSLVVCGREGGTNWKTTLYKSPVVKRQKEGFRRWVAGQTGREIWRALRLFQRSERYFLTSWALSFLTCVSANSLYSSMRNSGRMSSQLFPLFLFK